MIFGSFKGFHRLNPTSPAVPKPENIEWLFHFCRLENDPNAELLLFFDFGVATYRRQSFRIWAVGLTGDTDACCGHGVRVGVECRAISKVSSHREPVMGPSDSQGYTRLLLAKRRELSSAPGEAQSRVPAAGAGAEMLLTGPMPRRSFRSACIKPTVASYEQSKRHSLGSDRARMVYVWSASSLSLRLVWKLCRGRVSAASGKERQAPPDPGKREAMRAYVLVSARW